MCCLGQANSNCSNEWCAHNKLQVPSSTAPHALSRMSMHASDVCALHGCERFVEGPPQAALLLA